MTEWNIIIIMLNAAFAIFGLGVGYALQRLAKAMDDMERNIKENEKMLAALTAHIPASYVTKEELRYLIDRLFEKMDLQDSKLDSLRDKLDAKFKQ